MSDDHASSSVDLGDNAIVAADAPRTSRHRGRRAVAVAAAITSLVIAPMSAWAAISFTDVPPSHPFHDQIIWMADTGIAGGFADGSYKPAAAVTRQSMAAFLKRDFDLQNGTDLFDSVGIINSNPTGSDVFVGVVDEADVPITPATITVPEGTTAMLEITLSGRLTCVEADAPADAETCAVRVLVDGLATDAGLTSIPGSSNELNQFSYTFAVHGAMEPGAHTVQLQYRASNLDGDGDTLLWLSDATLVATAHLV